MRYCIYILLFFIYSCDELIEQSGPLDYENLIIEGWLNFVEKDYEMAEELFLEVLNIESSLVPYYSEAWLGLGWTGIYHAKELTGIDESAFLERMERRESAKKRLDDAYDEMDSYSGEEEIPYNLMPDLYAGLSYVYSSMALYDEFYGYDSDELIDSALIFSDLLLSYNPDYSFLYDSTNINSNSIHLLRAQLFLEQGQYDLAEEEISLVDVTSSQVSFTLERDEDNSTYDLFLNVGFMGQDKHLFKMDEMTQSTFELTRSFTPLLPCVDLMVEEIDLSDNEIVECLSSFPTDILEYEYAIRFPSSIIDEDNETTCEEYYHLEWIDGVGCVDSYIFLMEDFDDPGCITNGFRTLSVNEEDPLIINSCYNSCGNYCDN